MKEPSVRRRRLAAGGGVVALLVIVGAGLALALAGGGASAPRYVPAGGRVVSATTAAARLLAPSEPAFTPAPAAFRAARAMPLAGQVAQLFLVSAPSRPAIAAPGVTPWGGEVLSTPTRPEIAALRDGPAPVGARPLLATAMRLPEASFGSAGRATALRARAAAEGTRLHALGVAMVIGPAVDVDIDGGAFSGRLFSTNPQTVAALAGAALTGYAQAGTITAVGHFPGQGSASADPVTATAPATVGGSLASLETRDLVPYASLAPRAPVIEMSDAAYAAFDGVTPASLLAPAVSLLRRTLHYQGVVMSGDLDAALTATGGTPGQAALAALEAGDDLLYLDGPPSEQAAALNGIVSAAQRSAAVRARVHQALLRVLTLKARYGLLS